MKLRVYIEPHFSGEDKGDGGIRQIVEAQHRWLPTFDIEMVDTIDAADIVATHAVVQPNVPIDKPWIVHTHGLYWADYQWNALWYAQANKGVIQAMTRADVVTAPSDWVAQALRRGMWLRPRVLYHGVDPERWKGGQNGGYVLWNKTRVDPICDPVPLNQAAELLPKVNFVSTFGKAAPNVRLTGRLPFDAEAQLVKNAGVYLCTARETFGIGTLEAMAAGVPIVGYAWGGQREIVTEGATGFLVTPGDVEALADAIERALKLRDRMGLQAQADVFERWSWKARMAEYARLYEYLAINGPNGIKAKAAPRVSVIIPCYNLARFLPDTLKSLQAQSSSDWEAIVVDDCSPDDTAAVVRDWMARDKRIRYERTPHNLYLAGALNYGIERAQGRYVMPLDADNMIAPQTLSLLGDALDADRTIHIAYGAARFIMEDGTPDERVGPGGQSGWPTQFNFAGQMLSRNQIPSTSLYRRAIWERVGGYRTRWRTAEDADFWTRAVSFGAWPRKVTNEVTLIYRNRDDSMSRVNAVPDYAGWFPWTRHRALTPFGAAVDSPKEVGHTWPVPTYEPAKVAVVVPIGPGHEELAVDALDSVEAQTFRQWECIVVNDTGQTLRLPPWARVIDTAGRIGPAAARNLGIKAAIAPLFVPLDADDYLQPDALAALVAEWQAQGSDKNVYVYSYWYDDHGEAIAPVYEPPEYDANLLVSRGCIHAVTALYPKSAWERAGGFDEQLSHWEDWDFQLKLADLPVCGVRLMRPLFTYRKTTGFRREDNQAAFEDGKRAILAKWHELWEGRQLMACGTCGQRAPARPPMQSGNSPQAVPDGASLLEFLDTRPEKREWVGQVSGTHYIFNGDDHKRKWVRNEDVPGFLGFARQFRIIEAPKGPTAATISPQIVASGPSAPQQAPPQTAAPISHNGLTAAQRLRNDVTGNNASETVYPAEAIAEPAPIIEGSTPPQSEAAVAKTDGPMLLEPFVVSTKTVEEVRAAMPSLDRVALNVAIAEEMGGKKRESVIRALKAELNRKNAGLLAQLRS